MSFLPSHTYKAILRGDRIEWCGDAPDQPSPLEVQITVMEPAPTPQERRLRMVAALKQIASKGGIAAIPDPVQWQRETRKDRPLPGRTD